VHLLKYFIIQIIIIIIIIKYFIIILILSTNYIFVHLLDNKVF